MSGYRLPLLALALIASTLAARAEAPAADRARRVPTIVLERADILAGEAVPVRVLLSDPPGAAPARGLTIGLLGPDFLCLSMKDGPCPASGEAAPALGPFDADGPVSVRLVAGPKVREGKVNVVFTLAYDEAGPRRAAISETVEVGVFGVGSISGVPLQFAILFMPGMAALGLARLLGVRWIAALQAVEQGAVAIAISVVLAAAGSAFATISRAAAIGSALHVLVLTAAGLVLGLVFWGVSAVARWRESVAADIAAANATIARDDDFAHAVVKAIRLKAKTLDPGMVSVVRHNSGRAYYGSLTATAADGQLAILGWGTAWATDAALCKRVTEAIGGRQWARLAELLAAGLRNKTAGIDCTRLVSVIQNNQELDGAGQDLARVVYADCTLTLEQKQGEDTGQQPITAVLHRPAVAAAR